MTPYKTFNFDGMRLKVQRKKIRLTQKELAKLLGLHQSAVCDYERGRATPSVKTIAGLAVTLCTSADYLLGLTENPNPSRPVTALPAKEFELLEAFCSLPAEKQERAIGFLLGLKEDSGERP